MALALALVPAPAFATPRAEAVPAKFWGVVPQSTLTTEQFQRLGRGGVESVRIPLDWAELQPQAGGPIGWGGVDSSVETAALAGLDLLPTVTNAPTWAVPSAPVPGGGGSKAPARLPVAGAAASAWSTFLAELAARYGPNGGFWATHPAVPAHPIRTWQIWNEPNFKYFVAKPNPAQYGKLVKLSYRALRSIDPRAKLVLAGLFSQPSGGQRKSGSRKSVNYYASYFLDQMYERTPGIKAKFTGIALHPYTGTYQYLTPEIEEVRDVLKANRDAGKGLWITELGWSSGPPRSDGSNSFAKGPAGQAKQLKGAFSLLRRNQAKWHVQRLYWFSVDDAAEVCNFCDGSGLFGPGFTPKKSWYAYVKFAGGTP